MCVWDDAVQTFSDERGVDVDRFRVMTESMRCARLALNLRTTPTDGDLGQWRRLGRV